MPSSFGSLRIISGEYRRRKITFTLAKGDKGLLRPSGNRVRETVFNWLNYEVAGACVLDLFAGSGALGFEALSRSASNVTFVEKNVFYVKQINDNGKALQCQARMQVIQDDALLWLEKNHSILSTYNLIFLDPPFLQGYYHKILNKLAQSINSRCLIYVECSKQHDIFTDKNIDMQQYWEIIKHSTIGNVSLALIRLRPKEGG